MVVFFCMLVLLCVLEYVSSNFLGYHWILVVLVFRRNGVESIDSC